MPVPIANDLSPFGKYPPKGVIARILQATRRCSSSWRGKRSAFFLRAIAVRALNGRPLDVEAFGAKMRLYPYNNVCEKRILFTPQYFDAAERHLIKSRIGRDFVFIDVGANVGGYTLFAAAHAGPRARILAIEPQPEIFERLVYNIRQNPFGNVKAIACALADRDGEITLFVDTHNRGETSMRIVHSDAVGAQIRVPAKTLASLVRDEGFRRIDAIKLDVEGAEDLILEPFFESAPRSLWPNLIIVEYGAGRWTVDLPQILRDGGYAELLKTRTNMIYERR
ncbi:MAG: FkbM family methyltransferase [Methylobacteriaceae bacterium]|nr:FkbM family methyltransferase [Methylobacteriaceae bacterium]MBV9245601.1 FkbM family methyltransferase [Methylobacteriaceae bacterium]